MAPFWEVQIAKWTPRVDVGRGERAWIWIRDEHSRTVVDTEDYDVYPLSDEHKAMIESLPLALKACRQMTDEMESGREVSQDTLDMAVRAILKATDR